MVSVKSVPYILDFIYWGYKSGQTENMAAFKAYLSKVVERYDGDGDNDMPGLQYPVRYWEVGNEEEAMDGGFKDAPEKYVELIQASHEVIKAASQDFKVVLGGAVDLKEETKPFWREFFRLGGGNYIDVVNFHYNCEKTQHRTDPSYYIEHLDFFNELMDNYGLDKPMWITEFGTYSGSPEMLLGTGQYLPTQSEEYQTAWYVKYYTIGIEKGVRVFFPDLRGAIDSPIGAGAMFDMMGNPKDYVEAQKVMWGKVGGFSAVQKLVDGQYKFIVDAKPVYVLWGTGPLPAEITGTVLITDLYGNEQTMDATAITLSEVPIFVETVS